MAQKRALVHILQTKLSLIISQKDELHGIIDIYVDKIVALGKGAIDTEDKEMNKFEEINAVLETCLVVLAKKYGEIEDITSGSSTTSSEFHLSQLGSSSPTPGLSSVAALQTPSDSSISQLYNRVGAIEMALATCHSEVQQVTGKQKETTVVIEKLTEKVDSVQTDLRKSNDELASKMDMLADKADLIDVMKETRTLTKSYTELSSRVEDTERSMKAATSCKEKEENKQRELEDRVSVVEARRCKDLSHFSKKLEEVECQFKQVCHIVDTRVTPLRKLLHILNNFHPEVKKKNEAKEGGASAGAAQAVASKTEDQLLFSPVCGKNIEVINGNKTARKLGVTIGNAILLTSRPLRDNEVFEVRLDEFDSSNDWYVSVMIGVTTQSPTVASYENITIIKEGIWMMRQNFIEHDGTQIVRNCTQDLQNLKKGDRLGVVRRSNGTLHFLVNGTDLGACARNIPPNVYGILDPFGKVTQVTILDQM